jgi:hypothetical protein
MARMRRGRPQVGPRNDVILFVPQLLFAGFFVSPDLMPSWFSWARYLFALTYSIHIGVKEFREGVCVGGEQADMMCGGLLDFLESTRMTFGGTGW